MPNGYLGVDIFFVISGFVITSSLSSRYYKSFKDYLLGFYVRRIKRIIPALIFFVLFMSLMICLFNPEPQISLKTGLASLFGISNIFLFLESNNYFAESTELNVFTHTWSLGIEEQFYVFFPLLIWITGYLQKAKRSISKSIYALSFLSIISLIFFIFFKSTNEPASYYLLVSRFWEIASGSILFLLLQNKVSFLRHLYKCPPSLLTISIIAVFFLPRDLSFVSTILVVFLTLLLIICIQKNTFVYSLLVNKKVVHIGIISYSLYLWHWGILSLSRWTIGIYWWTIPFQILLIYFVSHFSYKFVEEPLRKINWSSNEILIILKGILSLFISGSFILLLAKPLKRVFFLGKIEHKDLIVNTIKNKFHKEGEVNNLPYGKNCHFAEDTNFKNNIKFNECLLKNNSDTKKIYFVGNSHTDHLREMHFKIYNNFDISIDGTSVSGCLFPHHEEQIKCGNIQSKQEERIIEQIKKNDIVVIGNRYIKKGNYKNYNWFLNNYSLKKVELFAQKILSKKGKVILITPTPEFELNVRQCISQWYRPINSELCTLNEKDFRNNFSIFYKNLDKLSNDIILYDPLKSICFNGECSMVDKYGKPIYRDVDHLTDYSSGEYVYKHFMTFLLKKSLFKLRLLVI